MKNLLVYSKEELATFILQKCFYCDIEREMKQIHIQYKLDKDRELIEKNYKEERELLNKLHNMPKTTLKKKAEAIKLFAKYKRLLEKNNAAYEKRQIEIDKLLTSD